jgi:hypothetical protein
MKKIAILAIAAVATTATYAQVTTTFGIKGGAQNNLLLLREDGGSDSRIAYTGAGFHVGGIADLKFSEHFSVQPQLLFVSKGIKLSDETSINMFTVDLPINLLYRNNGFFIGAGPNLSYGIAGKIKQDGSDDQDLYKDEDGNEAPFKRFDFGINTTLGYEFPSGLLLSAQYTPGLVDLANEGGDGKYNHRSFGISIGYLFNKGAAKKK